jgi:hypothetical protein
VHQLNLKSKPKSLTLQKVYELYRMDTGEETPEFIIKVLDRIDLLEKMSKYQEAKTQYTSFRELVEGMVGNGS